MWRSGLTRTLQRKTHVCARCWFLLMPLCITRWPKTWHRMHKEDFPSRCLTESGERAGLQLKRPRTWKNTNEYLVFPSCMNLCVCVCARTRVCVFSFTNGDTGKNRLVLCPIALPCLTPRAQFRTRSQRKRRNISTKTEMYVNAQPVNVRMACLKTVLQPCSLFAEEWIWGRLQCCIQQGQ